MRPLQIAFLLFFCVFVAAQTRPSRPEFIAGKHYSLAHCVAVIRWQMNDGENIQRLTGFELANLLDTLGNCETLYFEPLHRTQRDQTTADLATALDWASFEYIKRLESAIFHLDPFARQKVLAELRLDHYSSVKKNDIPLVTLDRATK